ncbi:hypothetical protein NQ315_015824 [Exocentrus adspersus]|uniref:ZAD domain-containing protein n=1 Tax=Exocentrus adspersus TaxID=1586481 RepID=A0AAV8W3F0_9CUCU|nr:hypothetical protein NQ315_015824 [Exocentrus adspersus]
MSYETIQINKICRTCLSEEESMRSIFSIDVAAGETLRLFEMLMSCASVQVMENDGLPSHVCLQCVHYITRAFSFKQLCERSENTLREILGRPIQATFLELKPLLTNDVLVSSTVTEIISTNLEPAETLPTVTETLNNDDSILPSVADNFEIKELKEAQSDLDMKFDNFGVDPACKFLVQNDADSDTGQDHNNEPVETNLDLKPEIDLKPESKEVKKKPRRDETEQPIYPCEQCTFCFTTQTDLRIVWFGVFGDAHEDPHRSKGPHLSVLRQRFYHPKQSHHT